MGELSTKSDSFWSQQGRRKMEMNDWDKAEDRGEWEGGEGIQTGWIHLKESTRRQFYLCIPVATS